MRNAEIASLLERMADGLALHGEDRFRIEAYRRAAREVRDCPAPIEQLAAQGQLQSLSGVGASIAAKISEALRTGRLAALEALEASLPRGAASLLAVPGLGPRRARQLIQQLRITSVSDLIQAAEHHAIQPLPGFGVRSEASLLREARRVAQRGARMPLTVAWPLAETLVQQLRELSAVEAAEPAGSLRRCRETVGDIDLLVASARPHEVLGRLEALEGVRELLSRGTTRASLLTFDLHQVDLRVVAPDQWGAAWQYFTGSKAHNVALRQRAIAMGFKLNEYGLFRLRDDRCVERRDEAAIYRALGLSWIPPELREDQGEIEAAERGELPRLVELADIRGDAHWHTTASDGRDSLEAMARAARERGYQWSVVTDHSYGLAIAHGLDEAKRAAQRAEIDRLNVQLAPFRLFQGVELEIRADGRLDFEGQLDRFEWVMASLHLSSREAEANTRRLLGALAEPHVLGINHPSGRIVGVREAYPVNLEAVLGAAIAAGKWLEVNGSERLDLGSERIRAAAGQGARFVLTSDAHSRAQLGAMRYAVALARRGWLSAEQVVNSWSALALARHLKRPTRP